MHFNTARLTYCSFNSKLILSTIHGQIGQSIGEEYQACIRQRLFNKLIFSFLLLVLCYLRMIFCDFKKFDNFKLINCLPEKRKHSAWSLNLRMHARNYSNLLPMKTIHFIKCYTALAN